MRQTSQISKFTSLRAGFIALSIFALIGVSGVAIANDAAPAVMRLRRRPIPSIHVSSTLPGWRKRGGLRAMPTPEGVPVKIRSPDSSVQMLDRYDTR